jgi:hypothetical protein
MKKIIFILFIVLVLTALSYWLLSSDLVFNSYGVKKARELASDWMLNNSPTYSFDGEGLDLIEEKIIKKNHSYLFVFSFNSRSGGYGDRSGSYNVQVITPHVTIVRIQEGVIVEAITDDVFSELDNIFISETETERPAFIQIELFFGKTGEEESIFSVTREIPYSLEVAKSSLNSLIEGPNEDEATSGYYSSINPETKINLINIIDGIAYVDFSSDLEINVAGSATVNFIREQIERTLYQFSDINEVIISIEGRMEDVLQP